ncbi:MAG: redoxin domain-containing protein [SAR202 cluster bacterium]|nr:redoxin domain-containing protein [SAR202 cluster bacterium]
MTDILTRVTFLMSVRGFKAFLLLGAAAGIIIAVTACAGEASQEGLAPEFALSATDGTTIRLTRVLAERDAIIIVFYKGFSCVICLDWLVELQEAYPFFRQRNAELVAISTDDIPQTVRTVGVTLARYPVLADREGEVSKSYKVYDVDGDGRAALAMFVIGPGREILWQQVGWEPGEEPSLDEVLVLLDTMSVPITE